MHNTTILEVLSSFVKEIVAVTMVVIITIFNH